MTAEHDIDRLEAENIAAAVRAETAQIEVARLQGQIKRLQAYIFYLENALLSERDRIKLMEMEER